MSHVGHYLVKNRNSGKGFLMFAGYRPSMLAMTTLSLRLEKIHHPTRCQIMSHMGHYLVKDSDSGKGFLVFAKYRRSVLAMTKPWYRRLFSSTPHTPHGESLNDRAEKGDAEAQFGLGLKYANSPGAAQDYPEAARWYLKAADQRHPLAQFNLGMMYANGHGMPADELVAAEWFQKAALQGDAAGQFHFGMSHHTASIRGSQENATELRIEAYKWLHLAAAQGYFGSDAACERVSFKMSREEVADGNHRAAAFVGTSSKPA